MARPQKLPKSSPSSRSIDEQYWVDHYEIYNDHIVVFDVLVRNGELTSERRERTLTTAEVDSLFSSQQARSFGTWMSNIHGFATPI